MDDKKLEPFSRGCVHLEGGEGGGGGGGAKQKVWH